MSKVTSIAFIIIFIQINLFFKTDPIYCQNKSYKFIETNRYGDKSEDNTENILVRPLFAISDGKNQTYILDRAVLEIKKFDKNGEGIKSIGREGQGPSEFLNVTTMTFNLKNELVVVDRGNAKFVVFKSDGQFVNTHNLPLLKTPRPKAICCTSDSGYIILSASFANDFILHKFTKNFEFVDSFGEVPIINDRNKEFEKNFLNYTPGEITIDSEDNIYYTPGLYDGRIYVFDRLGNLKIIKSKLNYKLKPYVYEILNSSANPKIAYEQTISNQRGRFAVHRNLISGGINIMAGGKIAHLVISYKDFKSRNFGIELFSADGLKSDFFKISDKNLLPAIWSANGGKWYFIDYSEDFPIVREYKFVEEHLK